MESDIPLMELAEEDDCLIQSFPDPNQTPSKSSLNYFNCSPLALLPSRIKSLKDNVHTEKPSSSSTESSNNKENINSNNVEIPKLGMGPIQMKRRKKGADYNLRKSLAWDRAFFTDEGILDPRELNMITGVNAYTCGRGLSSISEEGNSSFSSFSRYRNDPNNMEASKETLLKELYDKNHTPRNKVGNQDSLSHYKVANNVFSGSKIGGCSEPSPVSSLKRPNLNTLRTAKKESKIPKLPMSKSGSCISAMSKSSMTARHSHIPKPPINAQKNIGMKSLLKDKAKTGPGSLNLPDKEVSQKTVRSLTHSSSKATSSTKSQLVHAEKTISGVELVPDRLHTCEIKDESTPVTNLAQPPTTILNNKSLPSGLRLPSPSLRFFDQTRASESVSLQQKIIQQSNRQKDNQRPSLTPRTPSSTLLSSSSNDIWDKRDNDSSVYSDIVRRMQYECRGFDDDSDKVIEQEKTIIVHEGKMGIEKIALKGEHHLSGNETKDEFVLHNEEEKVQSHTATSASTSGQSSQHQEQEILTIVDGSDSIDFMQDFAKKLEIEPATMEAEKIIDEDIQKHKEIGLIIGNLLDRSDVNDCDSKPSNPNVLEESISHGYDLENSDDSAQILPILQENIFDIKKDDKANDVGMIIGQPLAEVQLESIDAAPLIAETASMDDNALLGADSVIVAEFKLDKKNQISQEMKIIIGSSSDPCDAKPSTPIVLEDSRIGGCDLENSNASAHILHVLQENVSDFKGDDKPNEAQGYVGAMPSMETNNVSKINHGEEVESEILQQGNNKDSPVLMKKSNNIKGQDKSLVIHPPNAVPFSDEWLAAIEAAGEEILTMKCGAVQHSPPDKSTPERNPWSPVKNKANQIGPYDCTKYINTLPSNSNSSDQ